MRKVRTGLGDVAVSESLCQVFPNGLFFIVHKFTFCVNLFQDETN